MAVRIHNIKVSTKNLHRSIWLFPFLLTFALIILTLFSIHGSSIGEYYKFFYGNTKDPSLILNEPRSVRSDEWLVNTQLTIAQSNNNFKKISNNVGNSQDNSVLYDVPYKDWSQLFKPHNWSFFILKFDNAFAFKWWLMGYLLILSCYFFILELLPKKMFLAIFISLALFYSPFIQWWYQYATLGSVFYSFFIAIVGMQLIKSTRLLKDIVLLLILSYLLICFSLILYPPFQIPCLIVLSFFLLGYLIGNRKDLKKKQFFQKTLFFLCSLMISFGIIFLFINTRAGVIDTIVNTAYPGKRIVSGGGFDLPHLFSSHLSAQFQYSLKASYYNSNQSEASNFILINLFLFLPGIFLLVYGYRKKREIDWPLLSMSLVFVFLMIRLFVPEFDWFFNLFLLDKVPQTRLLIGVGLLNFIYITLFIRNLSKLKRFPIKKYAIFLYTVLIFAIEVLIGLYIKNKFPGFIGIYKVWILAVPIPIIIYLLITKRFKLAVLGLLLFSMFSSIGVNPLYKGTSIITKTPVSQGIRNLSSNNGKWVTDGLIYENFALLNGAPSLSGTYVYPQLDIWKSVDTGNQKDIYNRYAHVNFNIDDQVNVDIQTHLSLLSGDHFEVSTEPCSSFLKSQDVKYILTTKNLSDYCIQLVDVIEYPVTKLNIYEIK